MRIRSLTLKFTLAFLFVSLIGTMLMALFVDWRTRYEFDQFVLEHDQTGSVTALAQHYRWTGSWQGVEDMFRGGGFWGSRQKDHPIRGTLVDANGTIVFNRKHSNIGKQVSQQSLENGVPIEVDGNIAGWLLFDQFFDPRQPETSESDFLKNVGEAILFSALGATVTALVLGILLARTLTRPIYELTTATHVVAKGNLGHQVTVRSKDELGKLATSFNQMSADLAAASKLRRQMTADIAHDLRTPLSVILGYTEALSDNKLQGTPEMYEVMHNEAQHLSHLIDDLRILSLADAGELKLTRQQVWPQELLKHSASAHLAQAQQQNVSLQVKTAADLPKIEVDPDRMAQVLGNLVSNALRYTPEEGRIVLSAKSDSKAIYLQVQDSGAGIEPEDLPHIFNRFYRADKSRQQQAGESGLGLAIARSIVETHGGSIAVESRLGEGTTFTITIPFHS